MTPKHPPFLNQIFKLAEFILQKYHLSSLNCWKTPKVTRKTTKLFYLVNLTNPTKLLNGPRMEKWYELTGTSRLSLTPFLTSWYSPMSLLKMLEPTHVPMARLLHLQLSLLEVRKRAKYNHEPFLYDSTHKT